VARHDLETGAVASDSRGVFHTLVNRGLAAVERNRGTMRARPYDPLPPGQLWVLQTSSGPQRARPTGE